MNTTNLLKAAYEKMPKGLKYALSPVFIRAMVDNPEFKRTWRELDAFERLTREEQEKVQLQRLKETLEYAYRYVPYYQETFDAIGFRPESLHSFEDIRTIPVLEKEQAVQLGSALYSSEQDLKYYKTFTGGSSGQSLTVLLDKTSIYRERACITHYMARFGYDPLKTKTVMLLGHNKDMDYYYSPLKNEIVISPFRLFKREQILSICDEIERFGATYLTGYPSAIHLFAQMLASARKEIHFDHVVYTSENCSNEAKQYIEQVFGCQVDSYYGHTERACMAEITRNGCVFNDYYGYTELLPTENADEYRIVCTGFLSRKMPLIRYATDDVVALDKTGAMHLIGHRRSEVYLISKNGQKIFKGAMTLHVEELKKVRRYQYVQHEQGKAELQFVLGEEMTPEELAHIEAYIRRRCEELLDVTIRFVDEVQLTVRGKFVWAVNTIEKKDA